MIHSEIAPADPHLLSEFSPQLSQTAEAIFQAILVHAALFSYLTPLLTLGLLSLICKVCIDLPQSKVCQNHTSGCFLPSSRPPLLHNSLVCFPGD